MKWFNPIFNHVITVSYIVDELSFNDSAPLSKNNCLVNNVILK